MHSIHHLLSAYKVQLALFSDHGKVKNPNQGFNVFSYLIRYAGGDGGSQVEDGDVDHHGDVDNVDTDDCNEVPSVAAVILAFADCPKIGV